MTSGHGGLALPNSAEVLLVILDEDTGYEQHGEKHVLSGSALRMIPD